MNGFKFFLRSLALRFHKLGAAQRHLLNDNRKKARKSSVEQTKNLTILKQSSTPIKIHENAMTGDAESKLPVFKRRRTEVGETEFKNSEEDLNNVYPSWDLRSQDVPVVQEFDIDSW